MHMSNILLAASVGHVAGHMIVSAGHMIVTHLSLEGSELLLTEGALGALVVGHPHNSVCGPGLGVVPLVGLLGGEEEERGTHTQYISVHCNLSANN